MDILHNQIETEERIIRDNLTMAGYSPESIDQNISCLLSRDPDTKIERNIAIRHIYRALRARPCALQAWYAHELLSKITGLGPGSIILICNNRKPENVILQRRKNFNQNQ